MWVVKGVKLQKLPPSPFLVCGDWEFTDVGCALITALVCNRKRKRLQLKRSRRPRKLMSGSLAVRFPFLCLSESKRETTFLGGDDGTLIFSVVAKGTSKADVAAAKAAEAGKPH